MHVVACSRTKDRTYSVKCCLQFRFNLFCSNDEEKQKWSIAEGRGDLLVYFSPRAWQLTSHAMWHQPSCFSGSLTSFCKSAKFRKNDFELLNVPMLCKSTCFFLICFMKNFSQKKPPSSSVQLQVTCVCFLQAVNEQRLIYSGKLLPDHLHIKDLFKQVWKQSFQY